MPKRSDRYDFPKFFRALSERARLRLLNLLETESEICVCRLSEITGLSEASVTRHLGVALQSGLVAARREGAVRYYRLTRPPHPHAVVFFDEVKKLMAQDREMSQERRKLADPEDPTSVAACAARSAAVASGALDRTLRASRLGAHLAALFIGERLGEWMPSALFSAVPDGGMSLFWLIG